MTTRSEERNPIDPPSADSAPQLVDSAPAMPATSSSVSVASNVHSSVMVPMERDPLLDPAPHGKDATLEEATLQAVDDDGGAALEEEDEEEEAAWLQQQAELEGIRPRSTGHAPAAEGESSPKSPSVSHSIAAQIAPLHFQSRQSPSAMKSESPRVYQHVSPVKTNAHVVDAPPSVPLIQSKTISPPRPRASPSSVPTPQARNISPARSRAGVPAAAAASDLDDEVTDAYVAPRRHDVYRPHHDVVGSSALGTQASSWPTATLPQDEVGRPSRVRSDRVAAQIQDLEVEELHQRQAVESSTRAHLAAVFDTELEARLRLDRRLTEENRRLSSMLTWVGPRIRSGAVADERGTRPTHVAPGMAPPPERDRVRPVPPVMLAQLYVWEQEAKALMEPPLPTPLPPHPGVALDFDESGLRPPLPEPRLPLPSHPAVEVRSPWGMGPGGHHLLHPQSTQLTHQSPVRGQSWLEASESMAVAALGMRQIDESGPGAAPHPELLTPLRSTMPDIVLVPPSTQRRGDAFSQLGATSPNRQRISPFRGRTGVNDSEIGRSRRPRMDDRFLSPFYRPPAL